MIPRDKTARLSTPNVRADVQRTCVRGRAAPTPRPSGMRNAPCLEFRAAIQPRRPSPKQTIGWAAPNQFCVQLSGFCRGHFRAHIQAARDYAQQAQRASVSFPMVSTAGSPSRRRTPSGVGAQLLRRSRRAPLGGCLNPHFTLRDDEVLRLP